MFDVTDSIRRRFEKKVDRSGDCHTWVGGRDKAGYGNYSIDRRVFRAHRVSFFLESGEDPGPRMVLHKCDNPSCVRASHLYLGDHQDNMRDRKDRGRNGNQTLDWDAVKEMRRLYLEGMSARKIDQVFGYKGSGGVVRNHIWKDPSYTPPSPSKSGRAPVLLQIGDETKSIREWGDDPRCEVAYDTLRKRLHQDHPVETILKRRSDAGRPRTSKPVIRASQLDWEGLSMAGINRELATEGIQRITTAQWESLNDDFEPPASLSEVRLPSSVWRRSEVARELGVPYTAICRWCKGD